MSTRDALHNYVPQGIDYNTLAVVLLEMWPQGLNAAGQEVHTDGWGAYEAIPWEQLGFIRHKHIHLNRRTLEHSNMIEGLWG